MGDIFFFSAGIFPQVFPCKIFVSLEISLQDSIFSQITHIPPQKTNGRPLFYQRLLLKFRIVTERLINVVK